LPLKWIFPLKKAFIVLNFPFTRSMKSWSAIVSVNASDGWGPLVTFNVQFLIVITQSAPLGPVKSNRATASMFAALSGLNLLSRISSKNCLGVLAPIMIQLNILKFL
jgi:hypothetical protein